MMADIKVYTTNYCSYCVQAKALLKRNAIPFDEIDLTNNDELRNKLSDENNGYRTVPMIFVKNKFIGGYQELNKLHQSGQLI